MFHYLVIGVSLGDGVGSGPSRAGLYAHARPGSRHCGYLGYAVFSLEQFLRIRLAAEREPLPYGCHVHGQLGLVHVEPEAYAANYLCSVRIVLYGSE